MKLFIKKMGVTLIPLFFCNAGFSTASSGSPPPTPTVITPDSDIFQQASAAGCDPERHEFVYYLPVRSSVSIGDRLKQIFSRQKSKRTEKAVIPENTITIEATIPDNSSSMIPQAIAPSRVVSLPEASNTNNELFSQSSIQLFPSNVLDPPEEQMCQNSLTPPFHIPPKSSKSNAEGSILIILDEKSEYELTDTEINISNQRVSLCSLGELVIDEKEPDSSCSSERSCDYKISVLEDNRAVISVSSETIRDLISLTNLSELELTNIIIHGDQFISNGVLLNVTQGSDLRLNATHLTRSGVVGGHDSDRRGLGIKSVIYTAHNIKNPQPGDRKETVSLRNHSSIVHNMPEGTGIRTGSAADIFITENSQVISYQGQGILLDCASLYVRNALIANVSGRAIYAVHSPDQQTGADIYIEDSYVATGSGISIDASYSNIFLNHNTFSACSFALANTPSLNIFESMADVCRYSSTNCDTVFLQSPQRFNWYQDHKWKSENGPGLNRLCMSRNTFIGVTKVGLKFGDDSFTDCNLCGNTKNNWWASGAVCQGAIIDGDRFGFDGGLECGNSASSISSVVPTVAMQSTPKPGLQSESSPGRRVQNALKLKTSDAYISTPLTTLLLSMLVLSGYMLNN